MEFSFSKFCTIGASGYEVLHRYIDARAAQGVVCEFPACKMPEGCMPEQTALGFLRQGKNYLLYWRPAVAYRGKNPALSALFTRSIWRFASFDAMTDRLYSLRKEFESSSSSGPKLLRAEGIQPETHIFSQKIQKKELPSSNLKSDKLKSDWPALYLRLASELGQRVLGQERAVEATAFRLYGHVGKRNPARPLSLIFHGPTGVGKSELGKSLVPVLERCTGRRYQFVWTELNTYTQPHSVHRLTGAPPGYVGYEDQPVLEAVRREPYSVFMFDELEKAHPEVLKIFLSILDEGRCTLSRADQQGNRELDFRRCIFIFTTNANLNASGIRRLGFSSEQNQSENQNQNLSRISQIKKAASPMELARQLFQETEEARQAMVSQGVLREIAGRFSGIIGFQELDADARMAITRKQIIALGQEYGLRILEVAPETIRTLSPGSDAFSTRSATAVLEGLLTPLFLTQASSSETRAFRLTGVPGALQLLPAYPTSSKAPNSSCTVFDSMFNR